MMPEFIRRMRYSVTAWQVHVCHTSHYLVLWWNVSNVLLLFVDAFDELTDKITQFISNVCLCYWILSICNFCRAMLCISTVYAVMQCPSVCLSVTFMYFVEMSRHIFKLFSPSARTDILVFFRDVKQMLEAEAKHLKLRSRPRAKFKRPRPRPRPNLKRPNTTLYFTVKIYAVKTLRNR